MTRRLIYVAAGEPSGDFLAARIVAGLRRLGGGDLDFAGVGGEALRAEGVPSLFPQADLAVMGLAEVVPRIPRILRRLDETVADIEARKPAAVLTVDSWGFNKRLTGRLRAAGIAAPRIHCVAPMVWAWRARRVHQLVGRVDLLLCLLPDEPALFERVGVRAIHIGHPVVESGAAQGDGIGFRARHSIAPDATLLTVLPGSRRSEISRLLPPFGETVARLAERRPDLRIAVPTVETVAEEVARVCANWPGAPVIARGAAERYDAFAASRAALAASGTVSLELAMAGLPMALAYKVTPLTAVLARRLLKVNAVGLPNLLLGRKIAPEFIQENCRAELLVPALDSLLDDEGARAAQRSGLAEAVERLGAGGEAPSLRAARAILDLIEARGG